MPESRPFHLRLILPAPPDKALPCPTGRARPQGLRHWRSRWAGFPGRHPAGAVQVLKPDPRRPPGRGLYLLRAEGVRPVVQNELNLCVRLAFRHQGRTPSLLVLPPSHFGVRERGRASPVGPLLPPATLPCNEPFSFSGCHPEPGKLRSRGWTNRSLGSVVSPARKLRGESAKTRAGSLRVEVTWEVQLDVFKGK